VRRRALPLLAWVFLLGLGARPALGRQAKVNPHGTLPDSLECSACHTDEGWVPLRATLRFEHGARSGFVLSGAHQQVPCAGCHMDLHFDGPKVKADDCSACHADVHEGHMTQTCTTCHTTRSFDQVDGGAIHARTSFPLTGAHQQVTCESCHVDDVGGAFTPLQTDCVACHQTDYSGAQTIDHVSAGYPTDCTRCHSTLGWGDAPAFDHAAASGGFTLLGAHTGLRCASCHATPGMEPLFPAATQDDCVACHQADYDREHGGSAFPTTCLSCHTLDTWSDADFDHALTGFQLQGRHATLECAACHAQGTRDLRFPAPSGQGDCVVCHQADYDHEHAGSGFPTTCLSCHNQQRWEGASFDHSTTGFALVGAHEPTPCADCHGAPDHLAAAVSGPEDCVACHRPDYDGAHGGSDFPVTCMACHTQASWEGATFDHATTGFSLDGPHATAECASCHSVPDYGLLFPKPSGTDDCAVCHQADYDQQHAGSGYPMTCLDCHAPDRWDGATFDHGTTSFSLVGAHAPAPCAACHGTAAAHLWDLPSSPDDCVACHQVDYDGEHAGSGIPTACLECHTQSSWSGAAVDHVAISNGFALDGPHATATCTSCHSIPDYGLLFPEPSGQDDCASCHQADYDREHAGSGFPTTCLDCHASNTWSGATVDHVAVSGGFDLVGPHATAACTSCHSIPDYGLLFPSPSGQDDCASCHQADYDREHAGSDFPTTCLDCHASNTWSGATVDHVAVSGGFDLVGPHATAACKTCHSVPDYALLFPTPSDQNDCVACHQADYDREHAGSDFPTTCLDCHASDTWSGATVDHVAISGGFELLGAHATATCTACHSIPDYGLLFPTPTGQNDCVACHQTAYDGAHGGAGYPTDCAACHTVNAWQPSTFDHDSQYFPIYSGSHRGRWNSCNDCHLGGNVSSFTCTTGCHGKSETDGHHGGVRDYAYEDGACLSCHPRGRGD